MNTVYTGIDFHKSTSTICYLTKDNKSEIKTIKSDNLVKELSNKSNLLVGIEASCGVNHAVEQLKSHGVKVVIINSNKFRGIGIGGHKTDTQDAAAIAECLKVSFIPTVHHKSLASRRLKSMLRVREQYVQNRVRMTNHIRCILREYGIKMTAGAEAFWEEVFIKIDLIDFDVLKNSLRDMAHEAKKLKSKEEEVEKILNEMLRGDQTAINIMSIPGIGIMTAAAFIAVGDDLSRFPNAKSFAAYVGLVPKEISSGQTKRMGGITKAGQEILRRYLVHGARSILKHTNDRSKEPIRVWANNIKKRAGFNKAVVALAHRLSRIAFRVAVEGRLYIK